MSSAIIENYYNKDVRTEVRIDLRESQEWPAITICPMRTLYRYFACFRNRVVLNSTIQDDKICSQQIKVPAYVSNYEFDVKDGCMIFNLNGTLTHVGGTASGIDISVNDTYPSHPDIVGFVILFYDAKTLANTNHVFYLYDIDSKFIDMSLKSGSHTFLLEMTEIEKLGSPYQSKCTKNQSIDDKHHSRYSYSACMDRCLALKLYEKCKYVPPVFQDYIIEPPYEPSLDQNETIHCYAENFSSLIASLSSHSDCVCEQPCKQTYYAETHEQEHSKPQMENRWYFQIRFKSQMVNVIKEHPKYSPEELLSNVGGICGLFLGMSILSLAEIFIHIIISIVNHFI